MFLFHQGSIFRRYVSSPCRSPLGGPVSVISLLVNYHQLLTFRPHLSQGPCRQHLRRKLTSIAGRNRDSDRSRSRPPACLTKSVAKSAALSIMYMTELSGRRSTKYESTLKARAGFERVLCPDGHHQLPPQAKTNCIAARHWSVYARALEGSCPTG